MHILTCTQSLKCHEKELIINHTAITTGRKDVHKS